MLGQSVGISDSCLSLQLERIIEEIGPRILLVSRPIEDILASFRRYLDGTPNIVDEAVGRDYLGELQLQMDRFRMHPLVRNISFDAMGDYSTVHETLRWLVPDADFPDLRPLMRMNIQVDRSYCLEMAARAHNGWHRQCSTLSKSAAA